MEVIFDCVFKFSVVVIILCCHLILNVCFIHVLAGDIVTVLNRRDKLKLDPHASPFSKLVCRDMLSCSAPPWERTTDDEL
jgi:hypothetical protein